MAIQESDIIKGEHGSNYMLVWDGWKATLTLYHGGEGTLTFDSPRDSRRVRYQILTDPQDTIEGQTGPGYGGVSSDMKHRIVFWVDFDKTHDQFEDDQRFDGYFFTQTRDAMAGVTWWRGMPFGFYAIHRGVVIG